MDPNIFGNLRLLWEWYRWGVFVAFVLAAAAAFWVFYDAQRRGREAILWKVVAVVSLILIIPSVIFRIDPTLFLTMSGAVEPLAWLGILGGIAALVTLVAYSLGVGVQEPELYAYPAPGPMSPPIPPTVAAAPPPPPPSPRAPARPAAPPLDRTRLVGQRAPVSGWLVLRSGPRAGKQLGLGTSAPSGIGRDASRCELVLDDPAVSREHARVQWEHGQFILYDLASANGTWVNNNRIQRQALMDGDMIRIGDTTMAFKSVK